MDCSDAKIWISARVDGEITDENARRLDEHLVGCDACRSLLADVESDDRALRTTLAPLRASAATLSEQLAPRLFETPISEKPTFETSREDHRRGRGRWFLAGGVFGAAAGLALSLLPWFARPPAPVPTSDPLVQDPVELIGTAPRLAISTGTFEVRDDIDAPWRSMPAGSVLPTKAHWRTGAQTRCEIEAVDGSRLRLDRDTVLVPTASRSYDLLRGRVWTAVSPSDVTFRVHTPVNATTVTALGTEFEVDTRDKKSRVTVVSGKTRVESGSNAIILEAGELVEVSDAGIGKRVTAGELILATRWIHELLAARGPDDPELNERIDRLVARIGRKKMNLLVEGEIRAIGDEAALPLLRYVESPRSAADDLQRVHATRLLADLAPSSFVPRLLRLLQDEQREVRFHAARGLLRLTGETGPGIDPAAFRGSRDSVRPHYDRCVKWWKDVRERYPKDVVDLEWRTERNR